MAEDPEDAQAPVPLERVKRGYGHSYGSSDSYSSSSDSYSSDSYSSDSYSSDSYSSDSYSSDDSYSSSSSSSYGHGGYYWKKTTEWKPSRLDISSSRQNKLLILINKIEINANNFLDSHILLKALFSMKFHQYIRIDVYNQIIREK